MSNTALPTAPSPLSPGEPLEWAHRNVVEPLLLARWDDEPAEQRLSDPWFSNLLLFRNVHGWRFHRGQWPVITGCAYDGVRLVLPLFDLRTAPLDVLRSILSDHEAFGPFSMGQTQKLDPAIFARHEIRDDADYLYLAKQFEFAGAALRGQRNFVRQMLRNHHLEVVSYTSSMASEALEILDAWTAAKGKRPGEADELPCLQALAEVDQLGLTGYLFRVDGQAAGFVLAQAIGPDVHVMRFAKGRNEFKGLYPTMFQHYCRTTAGLRWLNFEQDLGLPNFRRTKLSYRPAALLAKLRVTLCRA